MLAGARATHGTLGGVNNRDLPTLTTDLGATERLRPLLPEARNMVTESGIHSRDDVARMQACGVGAFLVGEAFMRREDPGAGLRELFFEGEDT